MTLRLDDMDVWLEAALDHIRDQLRANPAVGVKSSNGAKVIEVGTLPIGELAKHPDGEPSIWMTPLKSRPDRAGNTIDHYVEFEVQVFTNAAMQDLQKFIDAQKDHRKMVGRVWSHVLNLRDAGIDAGKWQDWWPTGEVEWVQVPIGDRALLGGSMRFTMLVEKVWVEANP